MVSANCILFYTLVMGPLALIKGYSSTEIDTYAYQYDQPADYDLYNYPEEEEAQNDVDSNVLSYRPDIISQPKVLEVDNGMTISLPCVVDKLPAGMQIIWTKVDMKNTIIAVGESVSEKEYQGRAFITTTGKGSTLAIGAAKASDAGKYKCSVALKEENRPEVIHTVTIKELNSATMRVLLAPQKSVEPNQGSVAPTVRVKSDVKDTSEDSKEESVEASPTASAKTSSSMSSAPSVMCLLSASLTIFYLKSK